MSVGSAADRKAVITVEADIWDKYIDFCLNCHHALNPATNLAMNPATNLAMNPATSLAMNPATSLAMDPATSLSHSSCPFELVYSDYLTLYGRKFLIIIDRHPAWLSVYDLGEKDGAHGLTSALKTHFATFGISMEITSDGGPEHTASATKRFLTDWDVKHRLSSAYFPHSKQHAELRVTSAKRMSRENVSTTGSLDTHAFKRALLTNHNTLKRKTGLSPAQIIFRHPIREFSEGSLPDASMKANRMVSTSKQRGGSQN